MMGPPLAGPTSPLGFPLHKGWQNRFQKKIPFKQDQLNRLRGNFRLPIWLSSVFHGVDCQLMVGPAFDNGQRLWWQTISPQHLNSISSLQRSGFVWFSCTPGLSIGWRLSRFSILYPPLKKNSVWSTYFYFNPISFLLLNRSFSAY